MGCGGEKLRESMNITVTIDDSKLQSYLRAAMQMLSPEKIYRSAGIGMENLTVRHLEAVSSERDGQSGFYEDYARSVYSQFDATGAEVVIPAASNKNRAANTGGNPLRAHWLGANIVPTTGHKYLTIPVGDARGTLARDYQGALEPAFGRRKDTGSIGVIGLRQKNGATIPVKGFTKGQRAKIKKHLFWAQGAGLQPIVFWLVKSVKLKPDPTVLPTREAYAESVFGAISAALSKDRIQHGVA